MPSDVVMEEENINLDLVLHLFLIKNQLHLEVLD